MLSIIIVSYNTREILQACLRSIFDCGGDIEREVIVVDNNSFDGSVEMIRREFPQVKLICNPANLGFAAANNAGLKIATGAYVLFLNSDTVITPGVLPASVARMAREPGVGVLGCKVLNTDGTVQPSARYFPTLWTLLLENLFLYKILPHSGVLRNPWIGGNEKERDVDVVKGAYFLVRRTAIDSVGVMDERFFLYSEEQDWCMRAKKSGWRVLYWPDGVIYHHEGSSSTITKNSARFFLYESEFAYFVKHYGVLYASFARIETVCGIALRLIVWCFIGLIDILTLRKGLKYPEKIKYCWFALSWHFSPRKAAREIQ